MAFDVAGRLAEGVVALNNTEIFVSACAVRGYHHADLTLHSNQLRDWYGTEEGLDLQVLDADCVSLRAAAFSAAEAVRTLPAGTLDWSGDGGSAAADFLDRHGAQAQRVAIAVDAAAKSVERLRDELWRLVDGKVDATMSLDERASVRRSEWLAAAHTVIAAGSSVEEAAAVVDSEIRPFVEAVVAGEWLPAMRQAGRAVAAAYRAAVDGVASRPTARFDIPGALMPLGPPAVAASAFPSVPTAQRASSPAFDLPPVGVPAMTPSVAEPVPNPMDSVAATPPVPVTPQLPAEAPAWSGGDPLSAVGGLPGRFADALGGLLGGSSGGAPALSEPGSFEAPEIPDFEPDPPAEEEVASEEPAEDTESEGGEGEAAGEEPPVEDPATDDPDGAAQELTTAESVEDPQEAVAAVPEPEPAVDPSATPCEIAADELPQVGQ